MFITHEFTANGNCLVKEQGAPGKRLSISASIEQKFRLFAAESENELITKLEGMGFEVHRKNYQTQLKHNLVTVCKVSEDENAALGIFINLERYEERLPSRVCLEELGKAILSNIQKSKHFGEGTISNSLAMSLLSNAMTACFGQLMELDQICANREV